MHVLAEEFVNKFISNSEKLTFVFNPEIERTFKRNRTRRQRRQQADIMNNQNNQSVTINLVAQEPNPAYLAHNLDRPIRSYALPNLYDFKPRIAYPEFDENSHFETNSIMLEMI